MFFVFVVVYLCSGMYSFDSSIIKHACWVRIPLPVSLHNIKKVRRVLFAWTTRSGGEFIQVWVQ